MEIEKVQDKKGKLVAVIGVDGLGLFMRGEDGKTFYISNYGEIEKNNYDLEDLSQDPTRTPVYEGEQILLKF